MFPKQVQTSLFIVRKEQQAQTMLLNYTRLYEANQKKKPGT